LQSSKNSDNIARQLQNKSNNPVGISRNIYDIIRFPDNQAVTAKKKSEIWCALNRVHKEYNFKI